MHGRDSPVIAYTSSCMRMSLTGSGESCIADTYKPVMVVAGCAFFLTAGLEVKDSRSG